MSGTYGYGHDSVAFRRLSYRKSRQIKQRFAIRYKLTGGFFKTTPYSKTIVNEPWLMTKATVNRLMKGFDLPADWEVIEYAVVEAASLVTALEKDFIQASKMYGEDSAESAQRVLEGGENYDGADGARIVDSLAYHNAELIKILERVMKGQGA